MTSSPGLDAGADQREVQRRGATVGGQAVPRADEGGELALQGAHLGSELTGEHPALEHAEHRAPLLAPRAPASARAPPPERPGPRPGSPAAAR